MADDSYTSWFNTRDGHTLVELAFAGVKEVTAL